MKEMSVFDSPTVEMPAYLSNLSNIESAQGIPSLSIRGKVFHILVDGEEKPIMRFDQEMGEEVPVSMLSIIVLDQGPFGARNYYPGKYDPANTSGPLCFSADGVAPDPMAREPQAKTCAACKLSVKGSKISDNGTHTTACQLQRRLAVVPANKPDFTPLLLRLAPTSAFDPETKNAQSGWFGWRQYLDFLRARGITHTAQIITKVRFDATAEHPKLLFRPERFLTEDEAQVVTPKLKSEEIALLLEPSKGGTVKPAAINHEPGAAIMQPEPEQQVASKPERKTTTTKGAAPAKQDKSIDDLLDDWDA